MTRLAAAEADRAGPAPRRWGPSRRRAAEWMDDPAIDPTLHAHALRGLHRINWLSGAVPMVWHAIRPFAGERSGPLQVGDLACGSGDIAVGIAAMAQRDRTDIRIVGYDVSATAVDAGRQRAREAGLEVAFERLDVLAEALPGGLDVLTCSLFLHHLDESEVVALLRRMGEAARCGVVVADLERRWLGHGLAWTVPRLITTSPVVHLDARLSARAAWTRSELVAMAERAGLHGPDVRPRWPARMVMRWSRS